MTNETRNITPPATASHERDDQTMENPAAKRAESLRTSEIRYRRLFESARDGILILDSDSRQITDVNPYMIELLEYSREEFIGKELYEIGSLADEEASQKVYRELQESGYVRYEDLPLETKSGKRWEVEFVCNLYDEGGKQVIQCNIRDITGRKQAEQELQASEARKSAILETALDCIIGIDAQSRIVEWNPACEKTFGYAREEVIGKLLPELIIPESSRALHYSGMENYLATGEGPVLGQRIEFPALRKNGEEFPVELAITRIDSEDIPVFTAYLRDITQHKRAEAALRQSEATLQESQSFLQATLDALSSHIAVLDESGTIIAVNREWERFAEENNGSPAACSVGTHYLAACDEAEGDWIDGAVEAARGIREVIAGRRPLFRLEYPCHSPAEQRWFNLRVTRFDGATPLRVVVAHENITERKQAEAALRDREAQFRLLADNAPDVISRYDRELRNIFISPAIERLAGIAPAALQNQTLREMGMPEELVVAWEANLRCVVETGQPVTFEFEFPGVDGGILHFESRSIPEFGEDGAVKTVLCIARDITERKRVEEALQAAKAEADRANRAKSEFLSRMSHELRTPMNAVLGFAQLLEMDDLNTEQRQGVDQILKGGRHLLGLINEVLDVTRIDAGEMSISPEAVQLGIVAQEAWDLVGPLAAQRNVEPLGDWEQACAHVVLADQQRLKQVLINLLSNAIKYNHEGGSVTLACRLSAKPEAGDRKVATTGRGQGDTAGDALALASSGNDFVPSLRLEITDTGPGIAPENLDKIFIVFERLGAERSETEGTGIGLALARRLMELMGGTIGVQSTLGQGSTFWIELPLAESPELPLSGAEPDAAIASTGSVRHAPRTILYVEDNLSNLRLIESILMRQPHITLIPAMQGGLGLELSREHHPDLILLDLHLPDISGDEVLRRLRAEPEMQGIPVVMLSGDATPRHIERLLEDGANAYLTKPLDVKRFLQVVEETLTKGKP